MARRLWPTPHFVGRGAPCADRSMLMGGVSGALVVTRVVQDSLDHPQPEMRVLLLRAQAFRAIIHFSGKGDRALREVCISTRLARRQRTRHLAPRSPIRMVTSLLGAFATCGCNIFVASAWFGDASVDIISHRSHRR